MGEDFTGFASHIWKPASINACSKEPPEIRSNCKVSKHLAAGLCLSGIRFPNSLTSDSSSPLGKLTDFQAVLLSPFHENAPKGRGQL